MELTSYFTDFIRNISPTSGQRTEYRERHSTPSKRLLADERLSPVIISTFLQGSYRRGTLLRPNKDSSADVVRA